jgi:hypothetical protein
MREHERTGKSRVIHPIILIIACLLLLCLVPADVLADDPPLSGVDQTVINIDVPQSLSVTIKDPFTGTWTLNQGPNIQDYGNLTITANDYWTLATTATHDDFVKNGGGTALSNPLKLNGGNVTVFADSGTGSRTDDLLFSQQLTIADAAGTYSTTVTFTVTMG